MTMQSMGEEIHKTAVEKGFYDDPFDHNFVLAKLALVASEVSEVLEAYRKQQGGAKIAEEMADVFIRLADLWVAMQENQVIPQGLDFDTAVRMKMNINSSRERKHGNLI